MLWILQKGPSLNLVKYVLKYLLWEFSTLLLCMYEFRKACLSGWVYWTICYLPSWWVNLIFLSSSKNIDEFSRSEYSGAYVKKPGFDEQVCFLLNQTYKICQQVIIDYYLTQCYPLLKSGIKFFAFETIPTLKEVKLFLDINNSWYFLA